MNFIFFVFVLSTFLVDKIWTRECAVLKSNTKLFCYYGGVNEDARYCQCTHVILPEHTELKIVEKIREKNKDVKILVTVGEFNEKLVELVKGTHIDGLELSLKKIDSKSDLSDFITTVKSKLGSDLYIAINVPSKTEALAKFFDFKGLQKNADAFILNTAFLGASQNVTFHPSRLSGLWDMQNTDSMVDLVTGLGAPLSKLVITAPVQAYQFTLQNEEYTAPGSPATEVKSITRNELCNKMREKGEEWTLERDQDQAGPYIFRGNEWISFEDETSIDIKTKYARVRSLAGVALKDLSQDSQTKCGQSLLDAAFKGLAKQSRAPRGAVLHTLEREILTSAPQSTQSVHASPFRISRIIDTEGKIHVIRQDTRTEFECSRQGYFVHPRSCNRFYRCVKFDQRTEEYNVFEFDCPAGLTFDEKTEVCVWPGSLPHASACSGSSEIAPVPQKRFTCPSEPGYYADPENCRWFFACLDHGEPTMQAYEFRCPFGLAFDEEKLLCEWPWKVSKCGLRTGTVTVDFYGGTSTNINQYDGLGVLQTVKLGGLQGPIQGAEARTYSNVGITENTNKILSNNQLIGENSAQFIDASRRLGLSLKATQSLYNAGLLNSNLALSNLKQDTFNLGALASEINSGLSAVQQNLNFAQNLAGSLGIDEASRIRSGQSYAAGNYQVGASLQSDGLVNSGQNFGEISSKQQQDGRQQTFFNAAANYQKGTDELVSFGQKNVGLSLKQPQGIQQVFLNSAGNYQQATSHLENSGLQVLKSGLGSEEKNLANSGAYNSNIHSSQLGFSQTQGSAELLPDFSRSQLKSGTIGQYQNFETKDLGDSTYSRSYFNLGQESKNQLNTNLHSVDLNKQRFSSVEDFSRTVQTSETPLGLGVQINGEYDQIKQLDNRVLQNQGISGGSSGSIGSTATPSVEILQNSEYIDSISQVTPSSVSYTTASSFGSILAATPLKTIDNYKQSKASGSLRESDGLGISQNNQKSTIKFGEFANNFNVVQPVVSGARYQDVQREQPRYVSSTLSPIVIQPVQQNVLQHTYVKQVSPDLQQSVLRQSTPSSYSYSKQEGYQYQKPSITVDDQEISIGTSYSKDGGYKYEKPSVAFGEEPQTIETSTSGTLSRIPIVTPSTGTSYSYIKQGIDGFKYDKPLVTFEEKPQNILLEQQKVVSLQQPQFVLQQQPQLIKQQTVFQQKPQVFSVSTPATSSYHRQDISSGYLYNTPQVVAQQPIRLNARPQVVLKQPQSVVTSFNYVNPVLQSTIVDKQPQIYVSSTQAPIVQQADVRPAVSQSYSYSQQNINGGNKHEKPRVVFEEKPRIIQQQFEKPSISTSYNINTGYKYEKPSITFEEKPRVLVKEQVEQPTLSISPILQEQKVSSYQYHQSTGPQQVVVSKPAEAVVTSISYNQPKIQFLEQQKLLHKQPQAVITSYNHVLPSIQPQVLVQQPQVYVSSTKTPIIQQSVIKPAISTSYSVNTGYKYDKPSVSFEEKPKVLVEQQVVTPTVSFSPLNHDQKISTYQFLQPVVQQPRGFSKVDFKEAAVQSYSYSNPVQPQYVVKPSTILSTTYRTPVAVRTQNIELRGYGYPRPQVQFVEEPKSIVTTYDNRVPVVETPIVPKKAYLTGSSLQYQNNVQDVQILKTEAPIQIYSTPRPTFVSTVASVLSEKKSLQLPRQEVVYYDSRLYNAKPQTQYFESSTLKPSNVGTATYLPPVTQQVKGYVYSKPDIQFVEGPKQRLIPVTQKAYIGGNSYQYYQSHTIPEQKSIDVQSDIVAPVYSTPRPTYISTIQSIVKQKLQPIRQDFIRFGNTISTTPAARIKYLESTTVKPIASVTATYLPQVVRKSQNVEVQDLTYFTPQIQSYQYTNQADRVVVPQKQLVVENYVNKQYAEPNLDVSYYTTPRPTYQATVSSVIEQKVEPARQEFRYYDSRYSSTLAPKIQPVETSTLSTPVVQRVQNVEFQGYDYPKPQVEFKESEGTSFESRQPVYEVPIIPKKAYITTNQNIKYDQETNIAVSSAKPIVLENYVASNYEEYSARPVLKEIYYSTPKPSLETVLAQKTTPVRQEFTYYDSRIASAANPKIPYSEPSRKTILKSSEVQRVDFKGYDYPKPQVQYSEEPQQIDTKIQVDKKTQPTIVESYVSPDYQRYEVPLQTSTLSPVLNQNIQPIRQEVSFYDSRLSTSKNERIEVTEAPQVLSKVQVKTTPVLVQKLEQEVPVQPFYYYDSRLSSTQTPEVEIVEEKRIIPEVVRQKVTSFDSRYSTTVKPSLESNIEIKSRPNVKLGVKYAEIETKEPSSTYLPILKEVTSSTQPSREYLPSRTTSRPRVKYLPSTSTVSNEYLPISSSESSADSISVENYENFELVKKKSRPVKVVKIVRPRLKTVVVKKNEYNPFLSAKLGAQCTCTSNSLELRKEPLRIEVEDYDDTRDDGDDGILVAKDDSEAIVVENYEADENDGDTPEVSIKSSTTEIPSSTYRIRKINRGSARAQKVYVEEKGSRKSRVNIQASEVRISTPRVRVSTPRVDIEADDESEVKIERRKGRVNSLESRAKQDVTVEVNSKGFERYGPGGVRNNAETLQGTDCQRAGLFRHPTQCNKFYSCRWDCKKEKFTLHVFNCPVHLTFDNNLGACNWPSQGPACLENTLMPNE